VRPLAHTLAAPSPAAAALIAVLRVALCIAAATADPQPANNNSKAVPTYTINLDLPADERWAKVAAAFAPQIKAVVAVVKARIPKLALPLLEPIGDDLEAYLPAPYAAEVASIAAIAGVTPAELFLMNVYYDVTTACTSIVAAHANGTVFHGRNLDYGIPGLQGLTADVVFEAGGAVAYRGTTYVGYVGLLTGLRPGAFSVSIDERDTPGGKVWENAAEAFLKGGHSIGLFLRSLLQDHTTLDEAIGVVESAHLDAPAYIIMGGTGGQGAIVTRERETTADTWMIDAAAGRWFLVETNDDHWKPPQDIRRDAANAHMNATAPAALTQEFMFGVQSAFPNLNAMTTYTTVMSVDGGVYYTVTRNN
jgi:N-acylethanolamine-hydrolysing acid amidase